MAAKETKAKRLRAAPQRKRVGRGISAPQRLAALVKANAALRAEMARRKAADDALRYSETKFRTLFENMSSGVAVYEAHHDGKDFIFKDLNAAAESIDQVQRQSLIGRSVRECFPGVVRFPLFDALQRVWKSGVPEFLPAALYQDDRIAGWRENYVYKLPSGEVVAVYDDVTGRKRAEEELRLHAAEVADLYNNAACGYHSLGPDGTFVRINDTELRWLGYTRAEVLGKMRWPDVLTPDGLRTFHATFPKLKEQGWMRDLEFDLVRKDGATMPVLLSATAVKDAAGNFLMSRSTVFDITERKRAEMTLRESELRYRSLVEVSPDAIFINRGGKLVFINSACLKLFGAEKPEQMLGRSPFDFTHPAYHDLVRDRIRRQLELGVAVPPVEEKIYRLDGTLVDVEVSAAPIVDGGELAVQAILRDITGRKQAEEALRKSEEQLRQAQKMDAIGQLAGGVAHDFNNLLTVIMGRSELALSRTMPNAALRREMEVIHTAGVRAAALTSQLLAFSRQQAVQLRTVHLNAVVEDMDKLLRRLVRENIVLTVALAPALGSVLADPSQMGQVLMNLVVNACDAMPRGGKLTIETANAELDEAHCRLRPDATPGRYVMLALSDNGCGMDAETQSHIFEPFFTTKPKGKGTGLGLATVYGIVKQSGGHIHAYSEVGKGTTFKVYFPRVQVLPRPVSTYVTPRRPGGHETILVVEDEQGVRDLACEMLTEQGYTVLSASCGDEALTILRAHTEPIHLLLTDVVMPGMSGPELAARLGSQRADIKVLFMSGYADKAASNQSLLPPNHEFIQKPFAAASLACKVREVLDKA